MSEQIVSTYSAPSRLADSGRNAPKAALCVVFAPSAHGLPHAVAFTGEPLYIGRHGDCQISLRDDAAVSRQHARIERRGDAVWVVDLGSTNGTWVQGQRVKEAELRPHMVLRIGNTLFRYADRDLDLLLRHDPEATRRASRVVGGARMRALADELWRVARSGQSLLLEGESGTGKELMAREVHQLSGRVGSFVAVHCRGVPRRRLEAELFGVEGHEASSALRRAKGGTLFLNHVSDLPLETQERLLTTLDHLEDTRLVSTSRTPLDAAVAIGGFHEALLARLAQAQLKVPALRERREDIVPLVEDVLGQIGRFELVLSVDFVDALARYDFPGNVRELEDLVKQSVAAAGDGPTLLKTHLPKGVLEAPFGDDDDLAAANEPTATVRVPKSLSARRRLNRS